MAEGMVGWIQLLGEQYCLAVIVCSSTCSGFPGLGPRAYRITVSRYTTIFCLPTITPTTTRTRARMKMRATMTRTATRPIRLVDLGILGRREYILGSSFYIDETHESNRVILTFRYIRTILFLHVQHRDFWRRCCETRLPALMVFPHGVRTAPRREIKMDVSICLSILPPICLFIYLSVFIFIYLSIRVGIRLFTLALGRASLTTDLTLSLSLCRYFLYRYIP